MSDTLVVKEFTSEQFGNVRTAMIDGAVWFVGKDVAKALGYGRATKAIRDHVDSEDSDEVPIRDSIGRMQNTPIINESGLYSLVLSSKLPAAKQFKHWITSDVLPAIRKTGGYIQPGKEELVVENYLPNLPSDIKDSIIKSIREQNMALITERDALRENIKDIKMANLAMASGILTWEDRARLNRAVRRLAGKNHKYIGTVWNDLYTQLLYKHGMMLKARGKAPYVQWIREDEWHKVIESFCAICEAYGSNAGEVFEELHVA